MSRTNVLYVLIAVLAIIVVVLGYELYLDRTQPGVHIDVGPNGLSIQNK